MSVTVITTFSEKNYQDYARHFFTSAQAYIAKNVTFRLYTDVPYITMPSNFENFILEEACPELTEFKKRNSHRTVPEGTKGFLKDAVRFAHKSYAIIHASRTVKTKRFVWLDADTEILCPLNSDYFQSHMPKGHDVAYLNRKNKYTETGYLQFAANKKTKKFFDKWQWYYDTDEIYNLNGQLDCHVFDACLDLIPEERRHQLSPPDVNKRHFDMTFRGFMCHYKGDDKQARDIYYNRALRKK